LTICYLLGEKITVVNVDETIYAIGSVRFIDRPKYKGERMIYARRCTNNPCNKNNCTFYHDPASNHHYSSPYRNFNLSYVSSLFGKIKNDDEILDCQGQYDMNYIRDLVQVCAAGLIRASQICKMHRSR
jgi:hypothetical protein